MVNFPSLPSPADASVCEVQWNPASPELLAVVLSSGSVYVLEVVEDVKVVARDTELGVACCEEGEGGSLCLEY